MTTAIPLDQIDRRILDALMRDATVPVAQLADRVGLSRTPCWKRVQKLEAAGIITARVVVVEPASVGLGLTVFVEVTAADHTPEWRTAFARLVEGSPSILEVHRTAGEVDYLLKVVVSDMADFDAFYLWLTEWIPCRNVTSKFSMERMKTTTVLPLDLSSA